MRFATVTWLVVCGLAANATGQDRPIVDSYSFHLGAPSTTNGSTGAEVHLKDRFFGNGTAQSSIRLIEQSSNSTSAERPLLLMLGVSRKVDPGEVVFALLVSGVEVRGVDSAGTVVFSRDLPGFTFGDSAPGKWYERIPDLPTNMAQLSVVFYGNYE